ncbi:MAG: molybdate ABC transporter substrate-binding protein [Candidatus Cloacimonetes bacterium]|nr:molybdate ABC transporter substrate-binding protein [Candidatus Cloacimonadota bacterium]
MFLSCFSKFYTEVLVAAAASTKYAMEEIASQYERETGTKIKLVFGSSGQFYTQIMQGAPFSLFLAADEEFVLKLSEAKGWDKGHVYVEGRLVLLMPSTHSESFGISSTSPLDSLSEMLNRGQIKKFAIANPEHAPYGKAAVQALKKAGLWDRIEPKLVYGENVSQAAQFALSGSTQGGLAAYSLALVPAVKEKSTYYLIDASLHEPLRQRMILIKDLPQTREFYAYLRGPEAKSIFERYGFFVPLE